MSDDHIHPTSGANLGFPRLFAILVILLGGLLQNGWAQTMRRPISPSQPVMMIHADVWNGADPQKVIDLIPADLRPYVVLNLSMSINHDATTGAWKTSEYGYETTKSWLRTAAESGIWATIQPSSGGFTHFKDYDSTVNLDTTLYGEFFRDYPNFLGINYAEQFWGFDDKWSLPWAKRVEHWQNLLKLTNKYGGYLIVSFTGGFYGAAINPVAMVKRNPGFAAALKKCSQNFVIEEKFTMAYGFHDIESTSMGMWLSGYAGHYGIRFDQCGWVPNASEDFPPAAGAIPYMEHLMLTGETVIDGPELIWQQSIKNLSNGTTSDGFSTRRWEFYPQFVNITLEGIRKVLDGTIRILPRKEVIDRSKVVIVNDMTTGNDITKYHTPIDLFQGLYLMDGDGTGLDQKSWFKRTGRYPAIPIVYELLDDTAKTFKNQIKRSAYASRWPTIAAKQAEMNTLFPQEATGTIYAARHENGWMTYNPYKTGARASGSIPFKYNTATKLDVSYAQYSMGILRETSDQLNIYLTNFDNVNNTGLMTDTLVISGCSAQPTFTWSDRGSHQASSLASSWNAGAFTLVVKHNGPLEIKVSCKGTGIGRLTAVTEAKVVSPDGPPAYPGPRQYEAENFDFKSIGSNVTNGTGGSVRNYQGLGYMRLGTNAAASVRDTIHAPGSGTYRLATRYSVAGGDVTAFDLHVNGTKVTTPTFRKTGTEGIFATDTQIVTLKAGVNVVMYKANKAASYDMILDNFTLTQLSHTTGIAPQGSASPWHSGFGRFQVFSLDGKLLGTVETDAQLPLQTSIARAFRRTGIYLARAVGDSRSPVQRVAVGLP